MRKNLLAVLVSFAIMAALFGLEAVIAARAEFYANSNLEIPLRERVLFTLLGLWHRFWWILGPLIVAASLVVTRLVHHASLVSQTNAAVGPLSGRRPRGITILAVLNGVAAGLLLIAVPLARLLGDTNFATKSSEVLLGLAGGGVYILGVLWVAFAQGASTVIASCRCRLLLSESRYHSACGNCGTGHGWRRSSSAASTSPS